MIFDLDTNVDLVATVDKAIVKVTVLFQLEFAYVTSRESHYVSPKSNSNIKLASYIHRVRYTMPDGIGYVIPVKNYFGYTEIKQYYLSDISFAGSLYKEQELNSHDQGYDVHQDMGSYFTRMDYIYDGLYLADGKFTLDLAKSLLWDAASFVFSFISFPYGAVLGSMLSVISASKKFSEAMSIKKHNITNNTYITS